jgi:hypothetical protein
MHENINPLLNDDPSLWIRDLPEFQRVPLQQLISSGLSYDDAAQRWLSASAANTYQFASVKPVGKEGAFLDSLRKEVRDFLCGDAKYEKERTGLFGEKSVTRTYVVSAIAVAVAPYLSVAATFIAPVVALMIAAIGKITLNAWCASSATGTAAKIDKPAD